MPCSRTFRTRSLKRKCDQRWLSAYLLDGSSYRRLGMRWSVGHMTAWRRVHRTLKKDVQVGVLTGFRLPREVRVLMLDAKHFMIRRKPFTLYVAYNAEFMRPVSWILLPRYELRAGYDRILRYLRSKGVSILAVVSDWHPGLVASVHDAYPRALHQHCAFHALADVLRKLGNKSFLVRGGRMVWNRVRHVALGCMSIADARQHLGALKRTHPHHARAWAALARALPTMYVFQTNPTLLGAYRTSNRIENCMGVIEQRIRTFRSMKSPDACIRIVSSFLALKYRKPTKK